MIDLDVLTFSRSREVRRKRFEAMLRGARKASFSVSVPHPSLDTLIASLEAKIASL